MSTTGRIKKKKSNKTPIKICFIGDNDEEESRNRRQLIEIYLKHLNQKTDLKGVMRIEMELNGFLENFDLYDISDKNEAIIKDCPCVIIIFDMNHLAAFDNVLDTWLIWLRDACKYEMKIGIIGTYDNTPDSKHYRITNEEVLDLISCSETSTIYISVGESPEEKKGKDIDDLIKQMLKYNKPQVKEEGGCLIF